MASAFLGKYASITAVDLISGRNWIPDRSSNPTEAKFEIIYFSTVLLE